MKTKNKLPNDFYVLIAEDSPTQAAHLEFMLVEQGYQVKITVNGQDALDTARQSKPDLIISDIMMPVMNGYELCFAIKQDDALKDIPVILVTTLSDPVDIVRGLKAGADYYLTKPFNEQILLARIQFALAQNNHKEHGPVQDGLEINLAGEHHLIYSNRQQMLGLLLSTYENAVQQNLELNETQIELQQINEQLDKKVAERTQKLQASQQRYRSLFVGVPTGLYRTTPDGQILDVNPALVDMLGYLNSEALLGVSAYDLFVDPQTRSQQKDLIEQRGELHAHTLQLLRYDGTKIWVEDHVRTDRDQNGKILHYEGSLIDITARKEVEDAIKLNEERLDALLELSKMKDVPEKELTAFALEEAVRLTKSQVGYLHFVNQDEKTIQLYSWSEGALKQCTAVEEDHYPIEDAGIWADCVRLRKPVVHNDYQNYPEKKGVPEGHFPVIRHMSVPVFDDDKIVAIAGVGNKEDPYYESDVLQLSLFMNSMWEILTRKRAEDDVRLRAKLMARLTTLSETLNRPSTEKEVVAAIGEGVLNLFEADRAAVYLRQPDDSVTCPWFHDLSPEYVAQVTMHVSEIPGGQLMQKAEPVILADIQALPEDTLIRQLAQIEGYRSTFLWPLVYEGQVIAASGCYYDIPQAWCAARREVMDAFANEAAVALKNANLLETTQYQTMELAELYNTAIAISGELETQRMLERLYEHVETMIEPDSFLIALYDAQKEEIQIALAMENGEPLSEWVNMRLPMDEAGLTGWVVQNRQPLLIDDMENDPLPVEPKHSTRPARSWLGIPLISRDHLIGVMSIQSFQPHAFDENQHRQAMALGSQVASVLENTRLYEDSQRRLEQLAALRSIDQAITGAVDLELSLSVVLEEVAKQLAVDAVDVLVYNPHMQSLKFAGGRGFQTQALQHTDLRLGNGYAGQAALERRTVHIKNIPEEEDGLKNSPLLPGEGFVSYYGVPLIAKGEIKGVLELFHRSLLEPTSEWMDFLEALAGQAAIAIDNATLFDGLQRSHLDLTLAYDSTLEGWAKALELRDQETEGHSRRVVGMTMKLAETMGIDNSKLAHMRRGALLHDIGKMGIPDKILQKPGPLDEDEWEIMRQHPVFAYEWLSSISYLQSAMDIPYDHHEKWDGTGYPRGLKGEQIPLAARIFAIVDVWDALSSDRPYRDAWPEEKVLAYLQEQSGKHFDPRVVEAFLDQLSDNISG
ncbi:MAG: GAF domain-containing protein [Chloroflexi bacterium]|nr:GAF domain-containing protein [Chloroflexota bacterium]